MTKKNFQKLKSQGFKSIQDMFFLAFGRKKRLLAKECKHSKEQAEKHLLSALTKAPSQRERGKDAQI